MKRSGRVLAFVGGIRSGKSQRGQEAFEAEMKRLGLRKPAYLGALLSEAGDEELALAARLTAHAEIRPPDWAVVDIGKDLLGAGEACLKAGQDAWFLDGLGAWAALQLDRPQAAMAALGGFLMLARQVPLAVLVLDEIGQGGVPADPEARAFCDLMGALNQAALGNADEAWLVQSGLPLKLK